MFPQTSPFIEDSVFGGIDPTANIAAGYTAPTQTASTTPTTTVTPTDSTTAALDQGGTTSQLDGGTTTATSGSTFDRSGAISTINEKAAAADRLFKTLFKGIDKVLSEQTGILGTQQAQVQEGLTESLGEQSDLATQQFAARGLADSSFRGKGLERIANEFLRLSDAERDAFTSQLAGLSREAAQTKAREQATQSSIVDSLGDLGQFSDQDLVSFRQQLDDVIASRTTDIAGLTTDPEALAGFDAASRLPGLREQLAEVAQAGVAPEFKAQIIQGLISNSGLEGADQQALIDEFLTPLGTVA